jgi:hypothetical protein
MTRTVDTTPEGSHGEGWLPEPLAARLHKTILCAIVYALDPVRIRRPCRQCITAQSSSCPTVHPEYWRSLGKS